MILNREFQATQQILLYMMKQKISDHTGTLSLTTHISNKKILLFNKSSKLKEHLNMTKDLAVYRI